MSKSLFRNTAVISSMTAISRIMGFARDMIIAQLFGAVPAIDAFYVAFRIPNFMRGLFAEGAFAQAFVPVLSSYRQVKSPEETQDFIRHMQGSLLLVLLIVTALAIFFAPSITTIFAPGFLHDPHRFELTTHMLRITFPYLLFISMTAFYAAILNAHGYFASASFTPVLLNAIMILAALCFTPFFTEKVTGLAWGVMIAGVVQCLFLMPFLRAKKLLLLPKLLWSDPGVRKVMKLLIPALFGVSVAQIGLLLGTLFASFLPTGSITWLYYSDRLIYFPLGIFGVALATVILPHLSQKHASKSTEEFSISMDWALRCVLMIAIPSSVGLYLLAVPLFSALFQYGKFHAHDALMASMSLKAFAFGLPAFMMVKVLASGFYSRQEIKTPVRIAVLALIANMILNIILIWKLKHVGLALATSLSSTLNALCLYGCLISKGYYKIQPKWRWYLCQLFVASSLMAIFLIWLSPAADIWANWSGGNRIFHLVQLLGGAISIYFICLWSMGLKLRDFKR